MSVDKSEVRSPSRTITFEVAVRRQRRWEVHATYRAYDRETALEEARMLEKEPSVDGTKVTKETWHHDTNRVDTAVIYRSRALEEEMIEIAAARPKTAPQKQVGFGARIAARVTSALGASDTAADREIGPIQGSSTAWVVSDVSMARALPWILISFIGACIVGGGATVLASLAIQTAIEDGTWISRQEQSSALVAVFLGVTGVVFVLALRGILARVARARQIRGQMATKIQRGANTTKAGAPVAGGSTAYAAAGEAEVDADEAGKSPDSNDDAIRSTEEASAASGEKTLLAGRLQGFETVLRNRLNDRLAAFDASQRFALNVYIAGAVDRLAQGAGLETGERRKLLTAPLIRLGTAPDIAARFGQSLDEHLTRPRALDVYNRGRDAAARFVDEDADAVDPLSAIAAWDVPASEGGEPESDIVAIMFTDIVGSTEKTHNIGDNAGQVIIRAHNAIVRDALKRCDGVEIKHTGDGIMASFAIASHAVEAAHLIQKNTRALAKSDPGAAFELRIGVNVGEPVRENDDLFGTAVQLAARLCAAGSAGQTIVSRVVRDLCGGKGYGFDSLGAVELRGIPGKTELYLARWNDVADAVPAAAAE